MIAYAVQWVRSLIFNFFVYFGMFVIGVAYAPGALFSRRWAYGACHAFCNWVIWSARWMVGLKVEVRGTPPTMECMVAAKHQSFLDIIIIFANVPRAKFIMKRELLYTPILGQFARRIGCVPVDRGKRGRAIAQMVAEVSCGLQAPGQLIIYPQGTRVAPGAPETYKGGSAVLYEQLGQPCVPAATNVGLFWPKRAVMRRPGTAIVEFLPVIEPGQTKRAFLTQLEVVIEDASDKLMAEGGFTVPPRPAPPMHERSDPRPPKDPAP